MKVFDNDKLLPAYLNKKIYEIILLVAVFIIVPAISIVIATRGEMRAVNKSLSWLAYRENGLAIVILWGIMNIAVFFYALRLTLDAGKYSKNARIFFFALAIASSIILTIGIFIPYLDGEGDEVHKYDVLRKVHNTLSTIGLVLFFVTTIMVLCSTYLRNKRQFALSVGLLLFILISSIGAITQANIVPGRCFVSSLAQIYMFNMFSIALTLEYYMMREMDVIPTSSRTEQPQD